MSNSLTTEIILEGDLNVKLFIIILLVLKSNI